MVKYVRDTKHGFTERPHYDGRELDSTFERIVVEFLTGKHGRAAFPIATEDLKTLIEKHVDDLDQYADLSSYGSSVEGMTRFVRGRKPRVAIARELSESDSRENRLRTTLTHEFGHVTLHAYLFELEQPSRRLLGPNQKPDSIYCKRDTIVSAGSADWMEWQAGYACGAVLMPARHVGKALEPLREQHRLFGPVATHSEPGRLMIQAICEKFHVSQDAARVRLSILNYLGTAPATGSLFA